LDFDVRSNQKGERLSESHSPAIVATWPGGQRGFRVAPISMADLEDVTNTRVMRETEARRQSIRHGAAKWEAALVQSDELLCTTERNLAETGSVRWERRNKATTKPSSARPWRWEAHIRLTHDIVRLQASQVTVELGHSNLHSF
jgi:hypothetical protein